MPRRAQALRSRSSTSASTESLRSPTGTMASTKLRLWPSVVLIVMVVAVLTIVPVGAERDQHLHEKGQKKWLPWHWHGEKQNLLHRILGRHPVHNHRSITDLRSDEIMNRRSITDLRIDDIRRATDLSGNEIVMGTKHGHGGLHKKTLAAHTGSGRLVEGEAPPEAKPTAAPQALPAAGQEGIQPIAATKPPPWGCNIYGLPKLTWAVIGDFLAMLLILLCVPLVLMCARRRPPGTPMFDFSCGSSSQRQGSIAF